jgi:hypothetical protein
MKRRVSRCKVATIVEEREMAFDETLKSEMLTLGRFQEGEHLLSS